MNLQERKDKGLELYKQGLSLSKASEYAGLSRVALTSFVKENGIELRNTSRKYTYNESFFEDIDTEDKAYWLGFIYADGCINDRGKQKVLEISLQESDKSHLLKFVKSIGASPDMVKEKYVKLNGKTILTFRVAVNCTKMCNDLGKYGVYPRKSLTAEFPTNIPNVLIRHFIRGYVDGDGCVQSTGKRDRLSVVGTLKFLERIQDYFEILGSSKTKISHGNSGNAYYFEKSGPELYLVYSFLYQNAKTYLDRKFEIVKTILNGNMGR